MHYTTLSVIASYILMSTLKHLISGKHVIKLYYGGRKYYGKRDLFWRLHFGTVYVSLETKCEVIDIMYNLGLSKNNRR